MMESSVPKSEENWVFFLLPSRLLLLKNSLTLVNLDILCSNHNTPECHRLCSSMRISLNFSVENMHTGICQQIKIKIPTVGLVELVVESKRALIRQAPKNIDPLALFEEILEVGLDQSARIDGTKVENEKEVALVQPEDPGNGNLVSRTGSSRMVPRMRSILKERKRRA